MIDTDKSHLYPSASNILGNSASVDTNALLDIFLHMGKIRAKTIEHEYPLMFPTIDAMGQPIDADNFSISLEHARALFSLAVEAHAGRLNHWLNSDENGKILLVDEDRGELFFIGFRQSSCYSTYLQTAAKSAGGLLSLARFIPENLSDTGGGVLVDTIGFMPQKSYNATDEQSISRAFSDSLITIGLSGKREIFSNGKRAFFYPANVIQAWDALAEKISTQTLYFCSVCGRASFTKKQPWAKNFPDTCSQNCRKKKSRKKKSGGPQDYQSNARHQLNGASPRTEVILPCVQQSN